jgi:hypothetical protein
MNRFWKYSTLLMGLFLIFSLIGCTSESVTSQNNEAEVKQIVEENDNEVNSIKVSETSDVQVIEPESSPTEKDEINISGEGSSEKNQEHTSTATKVETNQVIASSSNKETEKTETVAKTDTKKVSLPTATKETKQKEDNTTSEKVTEQPTKQTEAKPIVAKPTISITITGPKDFGVILPTTKVEFSEGDTVLDLLLKAAKKKNILVEHRGSGAMAYIEGIDNIYEFDYGPKSGWNYKLNGTTFSKSSGIVKVKKDDVIEWVYLENFTEGNE